MFRRDALRPYLRNAEILSSQRAKCRDTSRDLDLSVKLSICNSTVLSRKGNPYRAIHRRDPSHTKTASFVTWPYVSLPRQVVMRREDVSLQTVQAYSVV